MTRYTGTGFSALVQESRAGNMIAVHKMSSYEKRLLQAVLALLTAFFLSVVASATSLTILYTNDIHNRLESLDYLGELIQQERSRRDTVLLFDCGDTWHDFRIPIYAVWGSGKMVNWMNGVKYDAMAIGNHDLYYGPDTLAELASASNFPLLCANLTCLDAGQTPFVPYTMIPVGGLRVLVIGVITSELLCYPDYPWLRYIDPVRAIQGVLDETYNMADLVVVLGHLSVTQAAQIAGEISEIDVFLTGHSHEITPKPVRQGKTIIVQAGSFGKYLGCLELEIDPVSLEVVAVQNSLIEAKKTPAMYGRGYLALIAVVVLIAISLLLMVI